MAFIKFPNTSKNAALDILTFVVVCKVLPRTLHSTSFKKKKNSDKKYLKIIIIVAFTNLINYNITNNYKESNIML